MALFLSIPLRFVAFDQQCYYRGSKELERGLKTLKYSCLLTLFGSLVKTISYYLIDDDAVWMEALNICALMIPIFYAKEI